MFGCVVVCGVIIAGVVFVSEIGRCMLMFGDPFTWGDYDG